MPDEAIEAYVQKSSKESIFDVIEAGEALLAAPGSLKMAEMLILHYTEMSFVSIGMPLLQWIQNLIDKLTSSINL